MKKNLWRLATALLISSSCFIGTIVWFDSEKGNNARGDRKPVALLSDSNNEVQRKPVKRVIWETVSKNDELFPGEAIRTAPNSDARLFFMKTGTVVHLEPDSLVVLEENEKGLSLDFLQGNLFVQSGDKGGKEGNGAGLTLKTGNGEINLKSADMSLSKSQNGHVNLEVQRGEAVLSQGNKTTSLNREKSVEVSELGDSVASERVQILRPVAFETVYLNLASGEKLELNWKPLPAGYAMSIELGNEHGKLNRMTIAKVGGEVGKMVLAPKHGKWFMRMVATSTNPKLPEIKSSVVPFTIEAKLPPALLEPHDQAAILKPQPDAPTAFKWGSRNKFASQVLEVATDALFKNIKLKENFSDEESSFSAKLEDGTYYWRVTGFLKLKDKTETFSSLSKKFTLTSKWEIKAPTLNSPLNDQHLSFVDIQKTGIPLKWQIPASVERVKVVVERKVGETWKATYDRDTETSMIRLVDLTPGVYRWQVSSIDPKGGEAKTASPFQFTIEDLPKIEWVESAPKGGFEFEYLTPTPSLVAHWKPLNPPPAAYRYKVSPEGSNAVAAWQTTKQNLLDLSLPLDGRYQAIVEAVNGKNQLLAQSDLKIFVIKRRPLLPAPLWSANTPAVLRADGKGNLTFGWEQVPGAQNYLMVLESPEGKVVEQKEISRTTASFSRMKPGRYQVHLKSIDGSKRPGPNGDIRKIEVPATSDIRAPKIKAMKVK